MDDLVKQLIEILKDGYRIAYFSDPDNSDVRMHHLPVPVPKNIDQGDLPWRFHLEKPDESLQDPVWSDSVGDWVDNSGKSIPLQINQLTQNLKNVIETQKAKNEKDDQTLKALQGVQQGQAQTTAVLGQLVPMVEKISTFANSLQKNQEATKEGDK